MSLVRIERNPTGRQLLVFGIAWVAFFGLIALANWRHGRHGAAEAVGVLAAAVPLAGLASRSALRLAYVGLSYATYPIGFAVSHIVLALVYFLALAPIGLTMRLLGHDPLSRKFEPGTKSYWKPREGKRTSESYFNQS